MTAAAIAPALAQALDAVTVASDGLSATVGDHTVEAPNEGVLVQKLGATLYQIVHAGRREATMPSRPRTLRDRDLDRLFTEAMPHRTTLTEAVVHPSTDDGTFIAEINGLRVQLAESDQDRPLPPARPALATLALPAARPALSPGFFLTDGSRGIGRKTQMLRVYFHLTDPGTAPTVWATVLGYLEGEQLPYRAKISSNLDLYPRQDALVVYLGPQSWHAARGLAGAVAGMPGLGATTSALLHRIGSGVGTAWEPEDPRPGRRGLSFGEHRTGVLAEALVQDAIRGDDRGRDHAVAEAFLNAAIDPMNPARNLGSPALPVLDLV
ncbi:T3SS effector HopA1 family protein [Streptomyces sp. NBC_00212]|uniref:T3SS effector HopA1 family protein n=1 Tax=Streptomyces sp. NBC_00212 TaxID=2975684 RepID=UPI002F909576